MFKKAFSKSITFGEHLKILREEANRAPKKDRPHPLYFVQELYDSFRYFAGGLTKEERKLLPFDIKSGKQVTAFQAKAKKTKFTKKIFDFELTFKEDLAMVNIEAARATFETMYAKGVEKKHGRKPVVRVAPQKKKPQDASPKRTISAGDGGSPPKRMRTHE